MWSAFTAEVSCPRIVVVAARPIRQEFPNGLLSRRSFGQVGPGGYRLRGIARVWMTEPLAHRMEHAKYGGESTRKLLYFRGLPPPYFFSVVRSFGEYRAERYEIRPRRRVGSQELFARKPANIGDFWRSKFGERDLPMG